MFKFSKLVVSGVVVAQALQMDDFPALANSSSDVASFSDIFCRIENLEDTVKAQQAKIVEQESKLVEYESKIQLMRLEMQPKFDALHSKIAHGFVMAIDRFVTIKKDIHSIATSVSQAIDAINEFTTTSAAQQDAKIVEMHAKMVGNQAKIDDMPKRQDAFAKASVIMWSKNFDEHQKQIAAQAKAIASLRKEMDSSAEWAGRVNAHLHFAKPFTERLAKEIVQKATESGQILERGPKGQFLRRLRNQMSRKSNEAGFSSTPATSAQKQSPASKKRKCGAVSSGSGPAPSSGKARCDEASRESAPVSPQSWRSLYGNSSNSSGSTPPDSSAQRI